MVLFTMQRFKLEIRSLRMVIFCNWEVDQEPTSPPRDYFNN